MNAIATCDVPLVIDTRRENLQAFLSSVACTWPSATVRMNAHELYCDLFRLALRIRPRGTLRIDVPGMFLDLADATTDVALDSILSYLDIGILLRRAMVDLGDWKLSPHARKNLKFERVLVTGLPQRGELDTRAKRETFRYVRLMSPDVVTKLDKSTDLALVRGLDRFMINKADLSHFRQRFGPQTKFTFSW